MGRYRLDTVNDFSRRGYNLRIECRQCNRVTFANAVLMKIEIGAARAKWPIERLAAAMVCRGCGKRKAVISACEITF